MGYYVYVIAPEHGWPVKVGYGKNLVSRLAALQVGSYERLRIQKKGTVPNKSAAIRMERFIHKKLEQAGAHRRGEWFNTFVDDAIKLFDEAFEYQKKLEALKDKENWDEENLSFYGYIDIEG